MKNGFALPSFSSRGIRRGSLFSLSFGIALLFLMATGAAAETLTVNTTNDSTDAPACGTGETCSLRDAITRANADGNGDTIVFASTVTGTITLGSTLPTITVGVTIQGPGANLLAISGGGPRQILIVRSGPVTVSNLTFSDGNASGAGGAIYMRDNHKLNVYNCAFIGDKAGSGGGAIYDKGGFLTVKNSTFSGDSATGGNGGAIDVVQLSSGSESLTVVNSTFYGDSATGGNGGALFSSLPSSDPHANLRVVISTFVGNNAMSGTAIYDTDTPKSETVENDIFSGNGNSSLGNAVRLANNSGGSLTEDYNLFYDNHSGDISNFGPKGADDKTGDPMLASLADNGGQTQTMLPLPGSAAICAGNPAQSGLPTTDQRGFLRLNTTYNGFSATTPCLDIGAVQTNYQSIQFTNGPFTASSTTADVSPAPNVTVTENGQSIGGVPVTLDVSGGSATPTVSGNGPVDTAADGSGATFGSLTVSPAYSSYTLSSTLDITSGVSISTSNVSLDVKGGIVTTTTVTAAPNPAPSGAEVTLTAVVTAQSGTADPTGTVTFTVGSGPSVDGTAEPCPAGTAPYSLCATYTTGPLTEGTYTAEADFTSTSGFAGSSNTTSFMVESVTDYVTNLGTTGTLNHGQTHSLTKEWDDAAKLAAKGQFNGAIGNLETFIAEVQDLYSSGLLSEGQYNALIQAANNQISLYEQGST